MLKHAKSQIYMGSHTAGMTPFRDLTPIGIWCHARNVSKGVILQNLHTLCISKAEAQRVD